MKPEQQAFVDLLIAAMHDAALEGELTQLQTQFQPDGRKEMHTVRIIVVPEKLKHTWPSVAPSGTPQS